MTDALVAASRDAIARGSKSFALASRLFDPVTRDRATLLYAWCRHADDVIDGQIDGFGRVAGVGTPAERLAALEAGTRAALGLTPAGHADAGRHDSDGAGAIAFAALSRVAAEVALPPRYPLDLIEGFRSDVEERSFATFDDTLTYCYGVAGCVGVMMAIVMGVDPDRPTDARARLRPRPRLPARQHRPRRRRGRGQRALLPARGVAGRGGARPRHFRRAGQPCGARGRRRPAGRRGRAVCRLVAPRHPGAAVAFGLGGAVGSRHLRRHRPTSSRRRGDGARSAGDDEPGREARRHRPRPAAGAQPASALASTGAISCRTLDDALIRPPPRLSSVASSSRTGGA